MALDTIFLTGPGGINLNTGTGTFQSPKSLDALTGARFFAAFGVFVYHASTTLTQTETRLWVLASASVSFFFVLSGFILTFVYHEKLLSGGTWKFYLTRWARIWPLHIACLVGLLLFRWQVFQPVIWDQPSVFLANLFLVHSWVPQFSWAMSFNNVSWSISTEMGFYLLFPFLIRMRGKWFLLAFAATVIWQISLLVCLEIMRRGGIVSTESTNCFLYCNPLSRLLEFQVGMLAGRLFVNGFSLQQRRAPLIVDSVIEFLAIALLACSILLVVPGAGLITSLYRLGWETTIVWLQRGGGTMFASVFLIWVLAGSKGVIARFLSRPLIVFLGESSYSFYLVHYLIITWVNVKCEGVLASETLKIAVAFLLSIGISSLAFLAIEIPFREAMVAAFSLRFRQSYQAMAQAFPRLLHQGRGPYALLVCVLAIFILTEEIQSSPPRHDSESDAIVFDTNSRMIEFKNEAVLHEMHIVKQVDRYELTLVWEVSSHSKRNRFIHVCDRYGKVIGQIPPISLRSSGARIVIDRVIVPFGLVAQAKTLGVGFWDRSLGAARVLGKPTSMNGHRLDVFDLEDEKCLVGQGT